MKKEEIYELEQFLSIIDVKIKNTKAMTYVEFLSIINSLMDDIIYMRVSNPELTHIGFSI